MLLKQHNDVLHLMVRQYMLFIVIAILISSIINMSQEIYRDVASGAIEYIQSEASTIKIATSLTKQELL